MILGPMKSGKSFDLIAHFAPLQHTNLRYVLYQNLNNEREDLIVSRSGLSLAAEKVDSLPRKVMKYDIIGIDEIHMFPTSDVDVIAQLLDSGKEVVICGLDMDYRGKLFPIIRALMELAPNQVQHKRAVCEICKSMDGSFTQVFKDGKPVLSGIPPVMSENENYTYAPVCRRCFVQAEH